MEALVHKSEDRGKANHGWLNAKHSFSFANYYDPSKMGFGTLRVLNDDQIAPGAGFGKHSHRNMEIITIPTEGILEHEDSMGNKATIQPGEIQVMSAGSGVYHSEYNHSMQDPLRLFQIWVTPRENEIAPRYDQRTYSREDMKNKLRLVVSGNKEDKDALYIHQDAYFSKGYFEKEQTISYGVKNKANGIYLFVIEGEASTNGTTLKKRDAIGITGAVNIDIKVSPETEILLMEVPMA
jgi:redox-sensitive bicupin YhaK (pirin superfamily)